MTGNEHFEQKIAYHTKQRKVSNKWFALYKEIQVSLEFMHSTPRIAPDSRYSSLCQWNWILNSNR